MKLAHLEGVPQPQVLRTYLLTTIVAIYHVYVRPGMMLQVEIPNLELNIIFRTQGMEKLKHLLPW